MKKRFTNQKNNLLKLTKVFMIGALLSIGLKANAQCLVTAGFTFSTNPGSTGAVYFSNTTSANSNSILYYWNFGDGTYDYTANPVHVYNATGSYTVCLIATDSSGVLGNCSDTSCANIVIVNSNPTSCTANFTMYPDSANGSINTFTAMNYSTGTNLNYFWDFGDGSSSTLQNPTHTFGNGSAGTATYTVCLTAYSTIDSTCYGYYCQTISVGPVVSTCYASFQLVPDPSGTNTYQANNYSSGNGLNYAWDFGDGSTSTLENPTHTFIANGTYSVCLTVSSNSDSTCYSSFCDYITIGNNQGNCFANFYMYPDSATGAPNVYATMNYSTGNSLNYFWDFGDGTTSTLENPSHSFYGTGTYSVCLTVYSTLDSSCYNMYCQTITIGGNPSGSCSASFMVIQDSTTSSSFFLYLSTNNSNLLYSWSFGDGTSSTLQYPTHNYPGTGPYQICLTVSDGNGCTDTYCDSIYGGRSGALTVFVVNPVATSLNEAAATAVNSLSSFPNPFSENTTIAYTLTQNVDVEMSIIDLLGKTIAIIDKGEKTIGSYSIAWNSGGVAEGMYLLQLKTNTTVSTKKIVINK